LSFKKVSELPGVRITTDTSVKKACFVHTKEGNIIKLFDCKDGLYYHDYINTNTKTKTSINPYPKYTNNVDIVKNVMLVSTIENNKRFLYEETNKECRRGQEAATRSRVAICTSIHQNADVELRLEYQSEH